MAERESDNKPAIQPLIGGYISLPTFPPTCVAWFQPVLDLVVGLFCAISLRNFEILAQSGAMLTDDFTDKGLVSKLGTKWRGVSDQVMGGISEASISYSVKDGR